MEVERCSGFTVYAEMLCVHAKTESSFQLSAALCACAIRLHGQGASTMATLRVPVRRKLDPCVVCGARECNTLRGSADLPPNGSRSRSNERSTFGERSRAQHTHLLAGGRCPPPPPLLPLRSSAHLTLHVSSSLFSPPQSWRRH